MYFNKNVQTGRELCKCIQILQTKFHYQGDVPDEEIWKLTENGQFTITSAWESIRQKKDKSHSASLI